MISVAVHDIVIEPLKDEYEIGEVIKCSAQGHPVPTMAWKPKLSPSPYFGKNSWYFLLIVA